MQDKCVIEAVYGDFHEQMKEVVEHLQRAYEFANGLQKDMITEYDFEFFKLSLREDFKGIGWRNLDSKLEGVVKYRKN